MCKHELRQILAKIALLRSKQRQTKLIFNEYSIPFPFRYHIYEAGSRKQKASRIFVPRALICLQNMANNGKMANMAGGNEEVYEAILNSHESTPDKCLGKNARRKRRRQLRRLQGGHESYSVYITRVLKELHPDIGISEKAMKILDSFVHGLYEQLAVEASRVARSHRRKSLTSRDIETSVRVLLPEGLARRAMDKANQAVANLSN